MRYLIDTNICIYIMNERPPEVLRKFRDQEPGAIAISSITVSELQYGVYKSSRIKENRQRLKDFLYPFTILDYDEDAAAEYGRIRADLEKKGLVIGPHDMLIAAHAVSRNLTLVTNNTREFERIEALQVENWVN